MIESILDLHFDPTEGSSYWLNVLKQKGMQRSDIHKDNLHILGPMDVDALRTRPITDFIPKQLHCRMAEMVLAETGGTTGTPCRRVYLPEEFHNGFVEPWLQTVERFNFPMQAHWLFVGPSGPHIIGQAARAFARATNSLEPFAIDCDVRWIKQQQPESMGYLLYMDHLISQAINIISQQDISVLFTTPPLLLALAKQMSETKRQKIRGIHTGGMAQGKETSLALAKLFPKAVILPGYGNSLFGVCFEHEQNLTQPSIFFHHDPALQLQLIPLPKAETDPPQLAVSVPQGARGRVMFHRFDPSFLLLNMLERDTAIHVCKNDRSGFSEIEGLLFKQENKGGVY